MSIFESLLAMIAGGAGYAAANAKSKREIREMQGAHQEHSPKGCDPQTEYRIACEKLKEIKEYRPVAIEIVNRDFEQLSYEEIGKKYPEAYEDTGPNVKPNSLGIQRTFEEKLFRNACVRYLIQKKFTPTEPIDIYRGYGANEGYSISRGCENLHDLFCAFLAAEHEMWLKGFTCVRYATHWAGRYPHSNFGSYVCVDPTPETEREALSGLRCLFVPRRDGAAVSPDGLTEEEKKKEAEHEKEIWEFVGLVVLAIILFIIHCIIYLD